MDLYRGRGIGALLRRPVASPGEDGSILRPHDVSGDEGRLCLMGPLGPF
jgi:hypothetical protein